MRIIWSAKAKARLLQIQAFVAAENPSAATALVERLLERAQSLSRFPMQGRESAESSRYRELVVGRYRIVYRVAGGTVQIITVFEGHLRFPMGDLP